MKTLLVVAQACEPFQRRQKWLCFFSVSFQSSSFTWSMRCSTWSHIDMLCSLSPASEEICLLVMESVLFTVVTYLFYCKNCWVYGTCEFQGKSFVGYAQICGISHNCWNEKLLKKFLPGHLEEKKRITEEWTWGKDGGAQNNRWGRGWWSPEEWTGGEDNGTLGNKLDGVSLECSEALFACENCHMYLFPSRDCC